MNNPRIPKEIKTSFTVFQYDEVCTTMGWSIEVYYDRESEVFLVKDFPKEGVEFELGVLPEIGPGEIGIGEKTYKVEIRD